MNPVAELQLVSAVSGLLGAHRGVGTVAEVVDGCYTGRLSGPFCQGRGKLDRLAQEVGPVQLSEAAAYSDSGSDLALLRSCRRPVAVNPDRALRAAARASVARRVRYAARVALPVPRPVHARPRR